MSREIIARDWAHLNELLYENSWQESLGRFRATTVFRGTSDRADDILTSVARLGGSEARALEGHLLRAFRRYEHGTLADDASV